MVTKIISVLSFVVWVVAAQMSTPTYPQVNPMHIRFPYPVTSETNTPRNKTPVIAPSLCKGNELLYPGDNVGDWVCDCKPGWLFFPLTSQCFEAYTIGPCKENEIFKLPNNNSSIPECFRNTCKSGLIMYREKCVELDSEEPCKEFTPYVGRKVYLVYKPSTGELICESEDQKYHCSNYCCKGHKRNVNDVCPGKPPRKTYPKVNRT